MDPVTIAAQAALSTTPTFSKKLLNGIAKLDPYDAPAGKVAFVKSLLRSSTLLEREEIARKALRNAQNEMIKARQKTLELTSSDPEFEPDYSSHLPSTELDILVPSPSHMPVSHTEEDQTAQTFTLQQTQEDQLTALRKCSNISEFIAKREEEKSLHIIGGIIVERLATILLNDDTSREILSGFFTKAFQQANLCFNAKYYTCLRDRMKSLRIAIDSSVLRNAVKTFTLRTDERFDYWVKEIFADEEIKECVKEALKFDECKTSGNNNVSPIYYHAIEPLRKVAYGITAIEIMRRLQILSNVSEKHLGILLDDKDIRFSKKEAKRKHLQELIGRNCGANSGMRWKLPQVMLQKCNMKLKWHKPLVFFPDCKINVNDNCMLLTLQKYLPPRPPPLLSSSPQKVQLEYRPYCLARVIEGDYNYYYPDEDKIDMNLFIEKAFINNIFNLIFVTGEPFCGKTTFARKIAFDLTKECNKYEFVILCEIRRVPEKSYNSIFEFALAGTVFNDSKFLQGINGTKILIIFDGYDEKREAQKCSELDALINTTGHVEKLPFDLLITCRSSTEIPYKENATFYQIGGILSHPKRQSYIEKHFAESCSIINTKLQDNYPLLDLVKSPMMLTMFCLVHQDINEKATKAALLSAVVKLVIKRCETNRQILDKLNEKPISASGCEEDYNDALEHWRRLSQLQKFGQFAFDMVLKNKYLFINKDFEGYSLNITALTQTGLLFKESQKNCEDSYQFMHRGFQEFFAALYVIYWIEDSTQLPEYLLGSFKEVKSFKHRYTDFAKIILDVLMSEGSNGHFPIDFLLFEIGAFNCLSPISFQSTNAFEQYENFRQIMKKCEKIQHIFVDGMKVVVPFTWIIELPKDPETEQIWINLHRFKFTGTEGPIFFVRCASVTDTSKKIKVSKLHLIDCEFSPERMCLTADAFGIFLTEIELVITPALMEKFVPNDCSSIWSGKLTLKFENEIYYDEPLPLLSWKEREYISDVAITQMLRLFRNITGLNIQQAASPDTFPNFSYFDLHLPSLVNLKMDLIFSDGGQVHTHTESNYLEHFLRQEYIFKNALKLKSQEISMKNCLVCDEWLTEKEFGLNDFNEKEKIVQSSHFRQKILVQGRVRCIHLFPGKSQVQLLLFFLRIQEI